LDLSKPIRITVIDGGRIILNYLNGEVDLLIKDRTGTNSIPDVRDTRHRRCG